jgi:hypothetical protein
MDEKSFAPCKNLMKKALDFWISVLKAFMKTCFRFFAKTSCTE